MQSCGAVAEIVLRFMSFDQFCGKDSKMSKNLRAGAKILLLMRMNLVRVTIDDDPYCTVYAHTRNGMI
jgi:hypothetical protein